MQSISRKEAKKAEKMEMLKKLTCENCQYMGKTVKTFEKHVCLLWKCRSGQITECKKCGYISKVPYVLYKHLLKHQIEDDKSKISIPK